MPIIVYALAGFLAALVVGATTDEIIRNVYDAPNTAFRVNVVAGSLSAADITSGTTTITGGSDKSLCFDDAGVINCADTGGIFDKTQDYVQTRAYAITVPNAGVTGTTTNKLAKVNSSGQAVIVSTTDTDDAIGICVSGCGTTGSATIALLGNVSCIFDSATTAGNYIGVDTSTAGDCTDLGATFPSTGVSVVGRVLSTNGAGGTYAVNLNTPDVASVGAAGGGAKNPAGATGDVQYKGAGNNFGAEAAFNYDATNNRWNMLSGTVATDNSDPILSLTGTLPTIPTTTIRGLQISITSAGSASQIQQGGTWTLNAGYTGSSGTRAIQTDNSAAGTGADLELEVDSVPVGNIANVASANASTTGINMGVVGRAGSSTNTNVGTYGKAAGTVAGSHIGILGAAAASTEATDLKNVGVYGTLNSSLISGLNGSFAGLFDGGTLPDSNSSVIRAFGTLASAPSSTTTGAIFSFTSNGSAAQSQVAINGSLNAGYTGSSLTRAVIANNSAAGTGGNLQLSTSNVIVGNIGSYGASNASTAGFNVGSFGEAVASTSNNLGIFGRATNAQAGSNFGIFGHAAQSTEATDLKNVAGYFTLDSTLITGANISVALLAQGDGTDDIFRGYDDTTLMFRMEDTGEFTSAGTGSIGWSLVSVANQACNTTCTSACVFGHDVLAGVTTIVDCANANADHCLCAGAS